MRKAHFLLSIIITIVVLTSSGMAQTAVTFNTLAEGQKINGFTAVAVYLNDEDKPMGGRFIHDKTGFTLDLLQIESVPQTYIWVNSFPLSDKGEPHTQEHLLITKGNKGHSLNTRENMSLAFSNAFTQQLYTAYHFYTNAGEDVFYNLFENYLDALLHPDYTDEEVHREVCNWGVAEDAATKQLKIEEKGSVYNEMKTSMNNPYAQVYDKMGVLLYGSNHPMSYNAGGDPAAIRILDSKTIQQFHDLNYHLGNMGAITSLPKNNSLEAILSRTDQLLNRLQPAVEKKQFNNVLPQPKGAATGTIKIAEYPSANAQDPGVLLFAYPANLTLSSTEELLLNNFLTIFAGDPSTNLYKKFIDSKTKEADLGVKGVYAYADNGQGQPVYMALTDVDANDLTKEKAELARQKIKEELQKVAGYKDGSEELKEFNARFKNSLIDYKRTLAKFINTPPKFGYRNTNENWYQQLKELEKSKSFKKSIVQNEDFAAIEKLLSGGKNFWKEYLNKWNLLTAVPYVTIAKPNTTLLEEQDKSAKERAAAEIERLKIKYKVNTDQEAILKYKEEYESNTAMLEQMEQSTKMRFIDNPPLTLDDQLDYKTLMLAKSVPMVASTFNNMSSGTVGIAFNVKHLFPDKLVYLSMLPELLTQTGIIRNGKAVSYEDMIQQQRQEILSLNCSYSANPITGRVELVMKAAGNNSTETAKAVQWMNDVLQSPNWTMQNISRLRDLTDQLLSGMRKTMQGREESWVNDPADAYRGQDNPWYLASSSFLTQAYNIFRLRWMLMDAGTAEERNQSAAFLESLSKIKASRQDLEKLILLLQSNADSISIPSLQSTVDARKKIKSPAVNKTLSAAAADLEQLTGEIPDESLVNDWQSTCMQMRNDLLKTPEKTLNELQEVRMSILNAANARMFEIGSQSTQTLLKKNIDVLISGLSNEPLPMMKIPGSRLIIDRVKQRTQTGSDPVYVGLINPNSATGVFINSVPLVSYIDTTKEKLYQFLAAQLFGGSGKQSVYTKSTGAGLSYSTGVGASPGSGTFYYYAERTPLLPQTLSFIIDEIKKTPDDPALSEYIISLCVRGSRASAEYESRGEAMASDLADGITPDVVKNFRQAILNLRKSPGLMENVFAHKNEVYEKILPGYGIKEKEVRNGNYFVIGAEKQMAAYEAYLQSKDGSDTRLYRIYPRDYWMIAN